jgi:hypothetical protein
MQQIVVQAQKYGGVPHYEWSTSLAEVNDRYVLVYSEKNRQLVHHTKKSIFVMDHAAIEIFPLHEWYTVSIALTGTNEHRYYCNICMPSQFDGQRVTFTDLDLDVVRYPPEDWKVVDEDEFAEHIIRFRYPEELVHRAIEEKNKLLETIREGRFPFDGWLERKTAEVLTRFTENR